MEFFTDRELSKEVDKLKELIKERKTPESAQVTTRSMRKRSRQSEDTVETDMAPPPISIHHKASVKQIALDPFSSELDVLSHNPVDHKVLATNTFFSC